MSESKTAKSKVWIYLTFNNFGRIQDKAKPLQVEKGENIIGWNSPFYSINSNGINPGIAADDLLTAMYIVQWAAQVWLNVFIVDRCFYCRWVLILHFIFSLFSWNHCWQIRKNVFNFKVSLEKKKDEKHRLLIIFLCFINNFNLF